MESIINFLLNFASDLGYPGIVLLMTIESSFFPFPSEVVIPPAAYLAQKGEMNIILIILSGTLGSLFGAIFNYVFARIIGQVVIYKLADHKIARAMFISSKKLANAEKYFLKNANISTFIGRLLPEIRQLISLPAGFFKMDLKNFIIYTALGSSLWVTVLAALGYFLGQHSEKILMYYKEGFMVLVVVGVIGGGVWYMARRKKIVNNK